MPQPTDDRPLNPSSKENLDPDARFLLANERTLLAWIRTGLAVIAGGIALTEFGSQSTAQIIFGIVAILTGAAMSAAGYVRFRLADEAIRAGKLPDTGRGPFYQALAVITLAIIIAVIEITRLSS